MPMVVVVRWRMRRRGRRCLIRMLVDDDDGMRCWIVKWLVVVEVAVRVLRD